MNKSISSRVEVTVQPRQTAPRYIPLIGNFTTSTFYSIIKCKIGNKQIDPSTVKHVTMEAKGDIEAYKGHVHSRSPPEMSLSIELENETKSFKVLSFDTKNYRDNTMKLIFEVEENGN